MHYFCGMRPVGEGTRILNFLIDTALIFTIAYFGSKTWNWYVLYWKYPHYNFGWFFGAALFLYYTIFEGIVTRTPGKWLSFSKVVNLDGSRVSFVRVLLRSLARLTVIDLFFIPFLGKPLHDQLSGTTVVES